MYLIYAIFRLDNLIYDPYRPEVKGVLDWELSTLGDPLSDLSTMIICYYIPHGFPMFPCEYFVCENEDLNKITISFPVKYRY